MEWHGSLMESLHRVIIRFENNPGPFTGSCDATIPSPPPRAVRPQPRDAPGGDLNIDHTLTFTSLAMTFDRRTFLQGLGVGALGPHRLQHHRARPPAPRRCPFGRVADERIGAPCGRSFPLSTTRPTSTPADSGRRRSGCSIQGLLDHVDRLQEHSETGHDLLAPARESMARYLGAKPEEVCFTRNATEGNSIIAAGLALQPATR
jgi:hypothetical protein